MFLTDEIIEIANEIRRVKYPKAKVVFLAGSIVRGEGTAHSDLDLVIVFDKLPNAYRESFYFQNFPVEAFVHDPETINYFITEREMKSGVCVMAQMISEGLELPQSSAFSQSLKKIAASVIEARPPQLSEESLRQMRYTITNLIDDLRAPRSIDEACATGTALYHALANSYLRTNNFWAASDKSIPRKLNRANPDFARRFGDGFAELFAAGNGQKVIALAEEILKPVGGYLFEGFKLEAPDDNRKPFIV